MRLLYFNPENDLALAANDAHYTPPASALRMATDLQRLPLRWAHEDDLVLLRDGIYINAKGDPLPVLPLETGRGSLTLLPWGWSPLTVTDFLRAGVPAFLLPSPTEMQAFRTLAGRATAAGVLSHLRVRLSALGYDHLIIGEAYVCTTLEEARSWHSCYGESIFKQPWSGSGRGLMPAHDGVLTGKNETWLLRTLRTQGYVMAEPAYPKQTDFAMEFWRQHDGHIHYEGLSLFMTTASGVYAGNIVDSEENKRKRLAPFVSLTLIDTLKEMLTEELEALPSTFYEGPIGVDMLITSDGRLQPCIEINFRMTMGWLALNIAPF